MAKKAKPAKRRAKQAPRIVSAEIYEHIAADLVSRVEAVLARYEAATAAAGPETPVPHAVRKAARSIAADTIWTRLKAVFGAGLRSDTPISELIHGGGVALGGLANHLNKQPGFRADGLFLVPGDLRTVDDGGDIAAAIIAWYQRNGWKVTISFT